MTKHVLWAAVFGVLGFLYSLYDFASGRTGEVWLAFAAATVVCLLGVSWHYPRRAGVPRYELSAFTLWAGGYLGSSFPYPPRFFLGWIISALVGGLILGLPRRRKPASRMWRAGPVGCVLALVLQVGLLATGFTRILFFDARPRLSFRALATPTLDALAFSPDGTRVGVVGGVGTARRLATVWDVPTGRKLSTIRENNLTGEPKAASVYFVGDRLALAVCAGGQMGVGVWEVETGRLHQRFVWDDEIYSGVATFSRDGKKLAYANFQGQVRVFDFDVGRLTLNLGRVGNQVNCLAVTRSCDKVACATQGNRVEVWDVSNSRQIGAISTIGGVSCLDFSADGRILACGTDAGAIEIFDANDMHRVVAIPCFGDGIVTVVAFSPNGATLACGGLRGVAVLIDTKLWATSSHLRTWGAWSISCMSFSSDGMRLVTGNLRGDVAIWELQCSR